MMLLARRSVFPKFGVWFRLSMAFYIVLLGFVSASAQEGGTELARARATVRIERMQNDCTEIPNKCWKPAGSGFFSTSDGLWIITAAHVVHDKDKSPGDFRFRVRFGNVQRDVKVREFDKEADIACLSYPRELTESPVDFIPIGDPSRVRKETRFLVGGFPAGGAWREDPAALNSIYVDAPDNLDHHGKWRMQFMGVAAGDSGGPVIDTLTNRAVAIVSEAQPLAQQFYAAPLNGSPPCLAPFAPPEVDIWIRQADASISQGDFPTAKELFQKAAGRDQSRWEPVFGLARVAFLTGQYDEALRQYQKLSALLPNDLTIIYQQSICLDALRRYDDALKLLDIIKTKSEATSYLYKSAVFDTGLLKLMKVLTDEAHSERERSGLLVSARSEFEKYVNIGADFPQQWAMYANACIEALEAHSDRNPSIDKIRQAEMLFDRAKRMVQSLTGSQAETQRKLLRSVFDGTYERSPGAPPFCPALLEILESQDPNFRDKL